MEDTLIGFEVAKLAKEKGFDIPQNKMYSFGSEMFSSILEIKFHDGNKHECSIEPYNWNGKIGVTSTKYYSAPTQSLLQKWLREVHKKDVYCWPCESQIDDSNTTWTSGKAVGTYEEVLEVGLIEALKAIKIN